MWFIHLLLSQIITPPVNIGDVAPWLITAGVLGMGATLVLNLFPNVSPQRKLQIKFAVYVGIGLLSFGLMQIPADRLQSFQQIWSVLVTVIIAFAGDMIGNGLALLGVRMILGRDAAKQRFDKLLARG